MNRDNGEHKLANVQQRQHRTKQLKIVSKFIKIIFYSAISCRDICSLKWWCLPFFNLLFLKHRDVNGERQPSLSLSLALFISLSNWTKNKNINILIHTNREPPLQQLQINVKSNLLFHFILFHPVQVFFPTIINKKQRPQTGN